MKQVSFLLLITLNLSLLVFLMLLVPADLLNATLTLAITNIIIISILTVSLLEERRRTEKIIEEAIKKSSQKKLKSRLKEIHSNFYE